MNTRFEIEPDYADALHAAGLADFDALFNATSAGPPTSKHKHRETVPIEFDVNGKRQRFFLKRVFKVPGQHGWRPWLRGKPGYSQPVREWDNIKMMREAGLPVMKRAAVGERRRFGIPAQAFILVEDVGMQWTLENWLIPGFPKPPIQVDISSLWREIGRIRGQMDAAGLVWSDVAAKHIYAEPQSQEDGRTEWRMELIDVERVARNSSVTNRAIKQQKDALEFLSVCSTMHRTWRRSLVKPLVDRLWQPFWDSIRPRIADAMDEVAFRNGYIDVLRRELGPKAPVHGFAAGLGVWNSTHPFVLPDGFVHPRSHALQCNAGIVASDEDRRLLNHAALSSFESAMGQIDAESLSKPGLKPYRDRLKLVVDAATVDETSLFVKRYRRPPWREQLSRILESHRDHSTAYREFSIARRLLETGIPAAFPLAYGERMQGWTEEASIVVFRKVQGQSLEELAKQWRICPAIRPNWAERVEIANRLGHLVGRLHAEGWFHRDLYFSHVFLSRNADGRIVLQLIDLARMIRRTGWRRHWKWRWRVKDLAALAYSAPSDLVTRTDRMRFLRAIGYNHFHVHHNRSVNFLYRKATRFVLRWLLDDVNRRVAKMARHDAKRATRLSVQSVKA